MQINSFLGIRNTSPPRSIANNALADAVNLDIDNSGILTRRAGFALSKAITSITSAYTATNLDSYVVAGGDLLRLLPDLSTIALAPSSATAFADSGDIVFTNDGLKIDGDSVVNIRLPTPVLPPTLSGSASEFNGNNHVETYSATYCYRSIATGIESGSAPIASLTVDQDTGGVSVNTPAAPDGYSARVYVTEANGTVYYSDNGSQLNPVQVLADPFPSDIEQIAFYQSKLYLSQSLPNGSTVLWFSKPFYYHLYDWAKDYLIIPGRVLALMGTVYGLLAATDSAIYLYADGALKLLAGYGVIPGRPFLKLPDDRVLMHTQRGQCMGILVEQRLENITEKKVSFAPGSQCSTALVHRNGIQQFIVLNDGAGTAFNAIA
jgi:hypothetical protein